MYLRYRNVWCLAALVLLATMFGALSSFAGIDPPTLTATLNPTESIGEAKTVDMPGVIPQGDIMFSFDLTGSMGGAINTAKAEAINIMNALDALIADSRFGVISYMDYPASYSYCGYGATYGYSSYGDYAYSLDIPASMDRTAVAATINGLVLGYGGDGPQDYTRPFYESYADAAIGYRPGAKKILLNFGDNVPHDCDINEGVPGASGTYSTGGDPGRDEIIGTADDLDLQTVLADMADNDVTLLEIHTHSGYANYWQHWTAITGGEHYVLGSTSDIPSAIFELIQAQALEISELTLEVTTPGYEGWLVSVDPPMYADLTLPATVGFNIVITVPADAPTGVVHEFTISAMGDGASYGDQLVSISVPSPVSPFANVHGMIYGPGGSVLEGVCVDLLQMGAIIATTCSDATGHYDFGMVDNGEYTVEVGVPLGFMPVSEPSVAITVEGETVQVDFELGEIELSKFRNKWWWLAQLAALNEDPAAHDYFTGADVDAWGQLIFDHFYDRTDGYGIAIEDVTYKHDPPQPMTFQRICWLYFDAPIPDDRVLRYQLYYKKFLMALLLNFASNRMSQMQVVSVDGATASQAITYLSSIYNSGTFEDARLAYYSCRDIHLGYLIPAGVIPPGVPNIMFKPEDGRAPRNVPDGFALNQNYPNPFNPSTAISFTLAHRCEVTLDIYNIVGQHVETLVAGPLEAGTHTETWHAGDNASGIYLYRIQAGDFTETRKMVLLK